MYGIRVQGPGCMVRVAGCRAYGLRITVSGLRFIRFRA